MSLILQAKQVISKEESFIIRTLLPNFSKKAKFDNLNYDMVVKIASSQLMLPSLFLEIKKNKIKIPEKLLVYLNEIYQLNEERNKILIEECYRIKSLLDKEKINFTFIKGSYNVINKIYIKSGARMIGDIDFLFDLKDKKKITNILNNLGYKNKHEYKIWKTKHLPRFYSKENVFAVEPHSELLVYRFKKNLKGKKFLNDLKNKNYNHLKLCILNSQINDYNYLKATYNLRTIYDFFQLKKKVLKENFILENNIYFRRFYLVLYILGLYNYKPKLNINDKFFLCRFILKRRFRVYYKIDELICLIIIKTPKKIMQLVEFLSNPKYRRNAISKIFKSS